MSTNKTEFSERPETQTRFHHLANQDQIIIVTQAFGPNGESLMDESGHLFSGEAGVRLKVRQGDVEEDVVLSPFFGDPSKIGGESFASGGRCELFVSGTDTPLDVIPGMTTSDGGQYYAIYLSRELDRGELVAINDVWGNTHSRILSEGELLLLYADLEESSAEEHDAN